MQRVPRSQRGGEVIEPLVSTQWFVKTAGMAQKGVDAVRNGEIKIIPQRFEKTWYNWLENIHDWCVSRQLWWGHRIPVWHVEGTGTHFTCFTGTKVQILTLQAQACSLSRRSMWWHGTRRRPTSRCRRLFESMCWSVFYLLYWYKSTNSDAGLRQGAAASLRACVGRCKGP